MKFDLNFRDFNSFKFLVGSTYLLTSLFLPVMSIYTAIILVVGKAHSLGAWIAIWRAKKMNWLYALSTFFIVIALSYWAVVLASIWLVALVGYVLFAFHFLYDEFDLDKGNTSIINILLSSVPLILINLQILNDFFQLGFSFSIFVTVFIFSLLIDIVLVKIIDWHYLSSKALSIFALVSVYFGLGSVFTIYTLLIFHYFFWFAYPVYKLHKYNREERDGFIMILLIIMVMSVFIYSASIWGGDKAFETSVRTFFVASIAHILTTAPFGYLIGLPRSKKYEMV